MKQKIKNLKKKIVDASVNVWVKLKGVLMNPRAFAKWVLRALIGYGLKKTVREIVRWLLGL